MAKEELYAGREQTLVKHFILQKYLERFAHIVGSHWEVLTYVDCFSGPWNSRSDKFEDSSFGIALKQLRNARDTHAKNHRRVKLRCFFLEKNRSAYAQLKEYSAGVRDVEIEAINATLEESVAAIVSFVRGGGARSFPFVFIDPTGWSGFEMDTIAPLLQLEPGEVLINFMTGHIRRFLDSPQEQTQESFRRLFGSAEFRERIQGLELLDREDAAIQEYIRTVKQVGNFGFTCNAIVLHPEINRTHFHLIYATRNLKGVQVFKEIEKKAMEVQEAARAGAHQRLRENRTGQLEMLDSQVLHDATHYKLLRDRYLSKSREWVLCELKTRKRILYDQAWVMAMSNPMIWESDLKSWIKMWQDEGCLEVSGMTPRQKVPHLKGSNVLIWK